MFKNLDKKRHYERIYKKEYYKKHKVKFKLQVKAWQHRMRQEVLSHYGNKCVCCFEKNFKFLTLDHINNDGYKYRKNYRSGWPFYLWVRRNNYPNNLQIMCFNCNLGKHVNGGVCPHASQECTRISQRNGDIICDRQTMVEVLVR